VAIMILYSAHRTPTGNGAQSGSIEMKYRFAIQHTGRPYGLSETIPESKWDTISRHTSLNAAKKRLQKYNSELRSICGPNAYNDHHRIIALSDTAVTYTCVCGRPIPYEWNDDCADSVKITVPWPAGSVMPPCPTPDGWDSTYLCGSCRKLQDAHEEDY
jgi:hypothetical protein